MTGIRPGYHNGFAPRDGEPLYPQLWRSCVGAWAPLLGPSGITLRDNSGRGQHGILTNMDPTTDFILSGGQYALDFDGANDHVIIPVGSASLGTSFSVSLWVNVKTDAFRMGVLSCQSALTSAVPFFILQQTTPFSMRWFISANYNLTLTTTQNTWNHYVLTFADDVWTAYYNGVLHSTYSGVIGSNTGTNTYIGNGFNGYSFVIVDDLMYHTRVLQPSEVSLLAKRRGIAYELQRRRRHSNQDGGAAAIRRHLMLLGVGR